MNKNLSINRKLIILGEVHGADANIDVVEHLLSMYKIKSVIFEWPLRWQSLVDIFPSKIRQAVKIFSGLKDGRIQTRHIPLIKKLKERGVRVFCMDSVAKHWNERDKKNAEIISRIIKDDENTPCIAIMGRLHARKKIFSLHKQKMIPVGSYFKDSGIHIVIRYGRGEINNLGLVSVSDAEALRKAKKKNFSLIKSQSVYFDFDFVVKETQPALLLKM